MVDENDLSYLSDDSDTGDTTDTDVVEEVVEEQPEEATEEPADEQSDEGAEEVEGEPEVHVEPKPKQRGENRVQKLANERNSEREARIRAEAERDALLKFRPATPAPDNSEAVRLRNEKLSLLEPTERAIFLQSERLDQMNHQLLVSQLRSEDTADKASYNAKATVDARYARHKDAVEKLLVDYRTKGVNPSREELFYLVLGREVANKKPSKSAREAASQRVASTTGKPLPAKGNSSAGGGNKNGSDLASIEARLKGKSFNSMFNN